MATLDCLRHPHHISLIDRHSLRAKLQHLGDEYYNVDALPSHQGVLAPKFDVYEIDTSGQSSSSSSNVVPQSVTGWLLVGDLPGVRLDDVKIEWIDESIIFIRGRIPSATGHIMTSLQAFDGLQAAQLKPLHRDRQEGSFERSVTFPMKVQTQTLEMDVKDGVLLLKVSRAE
ncbi:hypothetical protein RBB50_002412 [Rhinocladiella similis]